MIQASKSVPAWLLAGGTERPRGSPAFAEFIALIGLLMALVAFSIYTILPAFPAMSRSLRISAANDIQLAVSTLYLGMAFGQILLGPLSDGIGRRRAILSGLVLFFAGCLVALLAADLTVLLCGQFVQGFGLGAPRIVTVAMVRDGFTGRRMARVMSFIMVVFVLVPTVAPTLGQAILSFTDWRAIYKFLLVLSAIMFVWFFLRQPETLAPDRRESVSPARFFAGLREVVTRRTALGYTIVSGLISAAFIGYINLSQQILQEQYGLGSRYPLYHAVLALAIGGASFLNGTLVLRFGMQRLSRTALFVLCGVSFLFCGVVPATSGHPPLWLLISFLMIVLFCFGILIGNLNALAMQPLGHVAGMGAAVVGSLSTFIGVPIAILIGATYAGSVLPLGAGFAVCGCLALGVFDRVNRASENRREKVLNSGIRGTKA